MYSFSKMKWQEAETWVLRVVTVIAMIAGFIINEKFEAISQNRKGIDELEMAVVRLVDTTETLEKDKEKDDSLFLLELRKMNDHFVGEFTYLRGRIDGLYNKSL